MIKVKVGVMPGKVQEVEVNKGVSVYEVLQQLQLEDNITSNYELRVNGSKTDVDSVLESDSLVLLIRQVKGN